MNIGDRTVNPGELRTPVTFESRTLTRATGGAQVPVYATIKAVKVRWTNVHGQEARQSDADAAQTRAEVLARYRTDVDRTCVVNKGGERWEITSIDNIQERGEWMELQVKRMEAG